MGLGAEKNDHIESELAECGQSGKCRVRLPVHEPRLAAFRIGVKSGNQPRRMVEPEKRMVIRYTFLRRVSIKPVAVSKRTGIS